MKAPLLATTALGLGAITATATQEPEVQVIGQKVAGQVHILVGQGGNIGIMSGEDGVLMIDTQYAPLEEKIRGAIAEITQDVPSYVVNTHWHGDHVGGNAGFGKDGLIVAHQNVRARMKSGGGRGAPAAPEALPDLTYDDGMTIHYNGEAVHLVHLPTGHTDGDTIVFFTGSKVVHMGDLMFNDRFPFIDLDSGGSVSGYLRALKSAYAQIGADMKVIPGHGDLGTREDIAKIIRMIEASIEVVEARMAQGMSAQEIVDAGMPEEYASWSWGFIPTDRWLSTLYRGLTEEKRAQEQSR